METASVVSVLAELPQDYKDALCDRFGDEATVRLAVDEALGAVRGRAAAIAVSGKLPLLAPATEELPALRPEYDFVVVGAGSAGAVLAARLAALLPHHEVLLAEAGPDDRRMPEIACPSKVLQLAGSAVDWQFETVPQEEACLGFRQQRDVYTRGRALGGTSCLNYHAWVEGTPGDYDTWAALGCEGWSWRELAPHFADLKRISPSSGSTDGSPGATVGVTQEKPSLIGAALLEALAAIPGVGTSRSGNFNDGQRPRGGAPYQASIDEEGRRSSSARCFLRKPPPNLTVRPGLMAQALVFADDGHTCCGVRFMEEEKEEEASNGTADFITIRAKREVILCGGAVSSPQLLQLSGLGPRPLLKSLGIRVAAEVPGIGSRLQDHILCTVGFPLSERGRNVVRETLGERPLSPAAAEVLFAMLGVGPLAGRRNAVGTIAFFQLPGIDNPDDVESFQFLFLCGKPMGFVRMRPLALDLPPAEEEPQSLVFVVKLLHPSSRGSVTAVAADARSPPAIDPRFFSDPGDLEMLVKGIRVAERVAAHPSLSPFLEAPFKPYCLPDSVRPQEITPGSDEYWRWHLKHFAHSAWHPVGTCAMGGPEMPLDPSLRVRGVAGVRVADASVMPTLPSGNINAACMMIGHKGAQIIADEL